jgi:hypothetical protein
MSRPDGAATTPNKSVIVTRGEEVIEIPIEVWNLIMDCAGQMIDDNNHFDYYKGRVPKKTLENVSIIYRKIRR